MTATAATVRRGLSDLAIRNMFVVPTIVFLILINIFPLFYSLIPTAQYQEGPRIGSVSKIIVNFYVIPMFGKVSISL
jgi:hypothetical protein